MQTAIYARISKDRAGEGLGVARQQQACTAKAEAMGWTVAEVYTDNDVSASKTVPRPQYERLIANIKAGTVKALVVYDLDRLTRKPAELEEFITLADTYGVALANVSGDVDLTNANGRMIARIKGAVARQEAERIGERNKAQKAQRAAMGLPMGTRYRVYGYNRDWSVNESEAAVVRDLFARYIAGESQNSLTRSLVNDGVLTTAQKTWSVRATSRLLTNAGYAGVYVFKGEAIGKTSYPALIDEATFEAANSDRIKAAPKTRKYLLSSILVCDLCKAPMTGAYSKVKGTRYRCSTTSGGCGVLSVKASWIDDLVNAYMGTMVMYDAQGAVKEPVEDNRLTEKDDEITAIQEADLELGDKVVLLKKARKERAAILKDQAETVTEANSWEPLEDYDGADVSVKRAAIGRYIKHIFMMRVEGKTSRDAFYKRFYVLLTDSHPYPGDRLVPGIAIDTVDLRERMSKPYPSFEKE